MERRATERVQGEERLREVKIRVNEEVLTHHKKNCHRPFCCFFIAALVRFFILRDAAPQ